MKGFLEHLKEFSFTLLLMVMVMVAFATVAGGQTPAPPPIQNFYGIGMSYSAGTPTPSTSVSGTALYAHAVSGGTYAFTAIDAVPNTLRPFTVNTNIGVGVAQKVATIKGVGIYSPIAAGFSFNGQNAGWQWNGGFLAPFPVKGYYVTPTVRFLKSSVGGSGYQPIVGVLFGWGK